jgi:hypothetical protein
MGIYNGTLEGQLYYVSVESYQGDAQLLSREKKKSQDCS